MRCAERLAIVLLAAASLGAEAPVFVHGQRYAMGTMFDIAAYHPARAQAERAIDAALAEIVRLDRVLSHFNAESDLSQLLRSRRGDIVAVDPALHDVLRQSIEMSRRSGGSFDVTIAPLVRVWEAAQAAGTQPSAGDIAAARRCVGYERVRLLDANRVRLDADCLAVDFGGIGKGYAVERAIRTLKAAGITHAVVNAGQSTIAAIGHPPGRSGWLVTVASEESGPGEIELRDSSVSTSRQARVPLGGGRYGYAGIIDPAGARPVDSSSTVVVQTPSPTQSDALSTTLLLLSIDEGKRLLDGYSDASALWISSRGTILDRHGNMHNSTVVRE